MKGEKVDELIQALDAMYDSGMKLPVVVDGGINDFLDNYTHGPKHNVLAQATFKRESGVRGAGDKTRVWAIFESAVISVPEPQVGTLFALEHHTKSVTIAVPIGLND